MTEENNTSDVESNKNDDTTNLLFDLLERYLSTEQVIVERVICKVYGHGKFFDGVDVEDNYFESEGERTQYLREHMPTGVLSDEECSDWGVATDVEWVGYEPEHVDVCVNVHYNTEDIDVEITAIVHTENDGDHKLIEAEAVIDPIDS